MRRPRREKTGVFDKVREFSTLEKVATFVTVGFGTVGIISGYSSFSRGSVRHNKRLVKNFIKCRKKFLPPVRFFGEYFPRIGEEDFLQKLKAKKYPELRHCFSPHLTGKSVFLKHVAEELPNCVYVNFCGARELNIFNYMEDQIEISSKYQTNDFFVKCMKEVSSEIGKNEVVYCIVENWNKNVEELAILVRKMINSGVYVIVVSSDPDHSNLFYEECDMENRTFNLDIPLVDPDAFPYILKDHLFLQDWTTLEDEIGQISWETLVTIATIRSDYGIKKSDFNENLVDYIKKRILTRRQAMVVRKSNRSRKCCDKCSLFHHGCEYQRPDCIPVNEAIPSLKGIRDYKKFDISKVIPKDKVEDYDI